MSLGSNIVTASLKDPRTSLSSESAESLCDKNMIRAISRMLTMSRGGIRNVLNLIWICFVQFRNLPVFDHVDVALILHSSQDVQTLTLLVTFSNNSCCRRNLHSCFVHLGKDARQG